VDAGLVEARAPVPRPERWRAKSYLLEADPDVPLPFETACHLAELDPVRIRAVVRLRLR
jgi:hypothetical protein